MVIPIAHWKFNETTGTTVFDSIGNKSGLNVGATINQPGKIGTAYSFNDDYISGPDINIGNGPFTFAAWVNYSIKADGEDGHTIFTPNWDYGRNMGYGWQIGHVNGTSGPQRIYLGINSITGSYLVPNNEWHHVACVHDGSYVTFFLDGVPELPNAQGLRIDRDTGAFYIGKESPSASNRDFLGLIDDLRVYNKALSQAEIDFIYNNGSGTELYDNDFKGFPAVHWKFNENTGSLVYDYINGYIGSLISGISWTDGKLLKACEFDGVDDYITCGNPTNLYFTPSTGFSSCFWIKNYGAGSEQGIINKEVGGVKGYRIEIQGNKIVFKNPNGYVYNTSSDTFNDDEWTHLGVTLNGNNTITYYINGSNAGLNTLTTSTWIADNSTNVVIGGKNINYPFKGILDDLRIYNYPLTQDEVKNIYNNGIGTESDYLHITRIGEAIINSK